MIVFVLKHPKESKFLFRMDDGEPVWKDLPPEDELSELSLHYVTNGLHFDTENEVLKYLCKNGKQLFHKLGVLKSFKLTNVFVDFAEYKWFYG